MSQGTLRLAFIVMSLISGVVSTAAGDEKYCTDCVDVNPERINLEITQHGFFRVMECSCKETINGLIQVHRVRRSIPVRGVRLSSKSSSNTGASYVPIAIDEKEYPTKEEFLTAIRGLAEGTYIEVPTSCLGPTLPFRNENLVELRRIAKERKLILYFPPTG